MRALGLLLLWLFAGGWLLATLTQRVLLGDEETERDGG